MMVIGLVLAVGFAWSMKRLDDGPMGFLLPGLGNRLGPITDDSFYAQRTRFESFSGVETRRTREQRQLIEELARRHIGTPITGGSSLDDLRVIQEILDKGILKQGQTYELQALGVALGDVLARQLGLSWVTVVDELGRSRVLRFRETQNLIFPVTMISKRVEVGVRFQVRELYDIARRNVEEFTMRADGGRRIPL